MRRTPSSGSPSGASASVAGRSPDGACPVGREAGVLGDDGAVGLACVARVVGVVGVGGVVGAVGVVGVVGEGVGLAPGVTARMVLLRRSAGCTALTVLFPATDGSQTVEGLVVPATSSRVARRRSGYGRTRRA